MTQIDVQEYLTGSSVLLGLLLLAENDIDFEILCSMSEEDLHQIGINSFGVRRKLTLAIQKLSAGSVSIFL